MISKKFIEAARDRFRKRLELYRKYVEAKHGNHDQSTHGRGRGGGGAGRVVEIASREARW